MSWSGLFVFFVVLGLVVFIIAPNIINNTLPIEETIEDLGAILEINDISTGGWGHSTQCIVTTEQKQIVLTGSKICSSIETGKRICHVIWKRGDIVREYNRICDE